MTELALTGPRAIARTLNRVWLSARPRLAQATDVSAIMAIGYAWGAAMAWLVL